MKASEKLIRAVKQIQIYAILSLKFSKNLVKILLQANSIKKLLIIVKTSEKN